MSPWRVAVLVVGLALLMLGAWVQMSGQRAVVSGPPTVSVLMRPALDGWNIVDASAARGPDDLKVTFTFTTQLPSNKRRILPGATRITATMSVEPPFSFSPDAAEPYLQAQKVKAFEMQLGGYGTMSGMADEVKRRTGLPAYAKAVRNLGLAAEIEEDQKWSGWLLGGVGVVLAGVGIKGAGSGGRKF